MDSTAINNFNSDLAISLSAFWSYFPIVFLAGVILISIAIEMYSKSSKKILPWFTVTALLACAYYSLLTVTDTGVYFSGMFATGGLTNIFNFIFTFGGAIVVLLSVDYIKKSGIYYGEFYILLQSAVLGMMMIAGAKDMIMIFIGLEQMSITFYVMAGLNRKRASSNEAALKYFLLGAFATGFIVYGIGLMYGTAGTLNIDYVFSNIFAAEKNLPGIIGILLFLVGFSFKIGAVPFHMWVPDVYQGAPTSSTALMATGGKVAAFTALILAFRPVLGTETLAVITPVLAVFALLSMFYGSIVAIAQTDIKRMLAYSSIANAGYMLIGLAAGNDYGIEGVVYYLAAYSFMNLGAFGIVALIESADEKNLLISDYNGLGTKYPVLAALLSLFMFALSGIPPFAGFFGKYYIFIAAIESDLTWLAIAGVIASVISVYFYLRIVVLMYFGKGESQVTPEITNASLIGIVISALLVIVMGVFPGSVINLISNF